MRGFGVRTGGALVASAALLALAPAGAGAAPPVGKAYHGTVESGANPRVAPQNTAIGTGTLQLVAKPIGADSGEPTIGIDRHGAIFYPADNFNNADGELAHTNLLRSTDHGDSWQDVSPQIAGQPTHQKSLDTYLFVDKHYGRVFFLDLLGGASELSTSDDEGATWSNSLAMAAGVNDHETLTTGWVPKWAHLTTSDPAFPKIVYYCANTVAAVTCSRSLDGGQTFTQVTSPFPDHIADNLPLSTLCSSLTGHLITDPDGRVYIGSAFNSPACTGRNYVAMSPDGGMTWVKSVVSNRIKNAEHEVTLASDSAGTIYAVWDDALHHLPYLAISRDHGITWGDPIMIAPPGVHETNFPTIDASEPGHIAIGFPGSNTATPDDPARPWEYYMVVSTDATSANPTFQSATPEIPGTGRGIVHRGDCSNRCGGMFDFLDMKIAPTGTGRAWGTVSDDCTGACVNNRNGASNDPSPGLGFAVEQVAGPTLGTGNP